MRKICFGVLLVVLAGGLAFAEPATLPSIPNGKVRHPNSSPLDRGPFTPEASRAYQGGGMILEGAPGAPAPKPEPTPPGQTPKHMVPLP
jgi:hypothetical protein